MSRREKKQKISGDYQQLQIKIFVRTILMMIAAVVIIFGMYSIFLEGRFANAVVGFLDFFIYKDYDDALNAYQRVFRNNMDLFVVVSILVVFLIAMRIYLNSFTRYFNEINRGIDSLIEEYVDDVSLSPELSATEKKINHIRHTLTERKLAAEVAEQRKNDLVVYLAHDLKTPLTSVIGYLTLLRDERQISDELREKYLTISLEKAERLEDLINEFFEITRFNLSDMTLEYGRVNLTRLLEQLAFEFKPMLLTKNLECVLKAAPDVMITCDADKMQRVFDNLLRNAVNYSSPDETILMEVEQDEKNVRIQFSNRGRTIPKEKLERIFEQFYRLDSARGTESGGAGLGLAIAKQIVELHGGTITVQSEDEVTKFAVTLPIL